MLCISLDEALIWCRYSHMPAERDFIIGEPTFSMRRAKSTDAVNNETIVRDRRLEALQTTPFIPAMISTSVISTSRTLIATYRSYFTAKADHCISKRPQDSINDVLLDRNPRATAKTSKKDSLMIVNGCSPFSNQDEVCKAMHNHCTLTLLDDCGQHSERGR